MRGGITAVKNILYEGYLGPRLPREVQLKRVQRGIREELERVYAERDGLAAYRTPKHVLPDKRYFGVGVCPSCGVVFLDKNTPFCGRCGQALEWE